MRARLNLAAINQIRNNLTASIELYKTGLEISKTKDIGIDLFIKFHFNLGSAYYQAGNPKEALKSTESILRSLHDGMKIYCSIFNQHENKQSSIILDIFDTNYKSEGLDQSKLTNSIEDCQKLQSNFDSGYNLLLTIERSIVSLKNWEYRIQYLLYRTLKGTLTYNNHYKDNQTIEISDNYRKFQLKQSILNIYPSIIDFPVEIGTGPTLPFDTLLYDISLSDKLAIATAASYQVIKSLPSLSFSSIINSTTTQNSNISNNLQKIIKIGFISYDINDHPTAHLLEGIFAQIKDFRSKYLLNSTYTSIQIYLFSYGRDDDSIYRKNLEMLSDNFFNLILLSDQDAVTLIKKQNLDILLDMQIFTLGTRFEITAYQSVKLQVNYLVYPGTSGASFLQYLVADHIVVPPEHSPYYSESLIYFPPPYQVSYYERYDSISHNKLDKFNDTDKLILPKLIFSKNDKNIMKLVNFNKIDKLDFDSLQVWSQIMNRFPKSVLYLLKPQYKQSQEYNILTEKNIIDQFIVRGVNSLRIQFASRTNKENHIKRHNDAHLFLDTLIYGAHSTATDALKGGLPVVTLMGNSFPSRVASSLLHSINLNKEYKENKENKEMDIYSFLSNILITYSKKSYEDTVIRLLKSPDIIEKLKELLSNCSKKQLNSNSTTGLFNTKQLVQDFIHGMYAMYESSQIKDNSNKNMFQNCLSCRKYPHIILTR